MKNYEKPIVLANNELFEGVYAASGTVAGGGAETNGSCSLSYTNSWDNNGVKYVQYNMTLTNVSGESITHGYLTAIISANGNISGIANSYPSVTLNGNGKATVSVECWNVEAGGSITGNVTIYGTGDISLG